MAITKLVVEVNHQNLAVQGLDSRCSKAWNQLRRSILPYLLQTASCLNWHQHWLQKGWDCSWEEYKRDKRKDKSYTYQPGGGIVEEFELTLKYLICLYQRVVST